MNREEILEKSKKENKLSPDKQQLEINKISESIAFSVALFSAIIIHGINKIMGDVSYDIMFIIAITFFASYLYRCIKMRTITNLVFTILFFAMAIHRGYNYWLGIF